MIGKNQIVAFQMYDGGVVMVIVMVEDAFVYFHPSAGMEPFVLGHSAR